MLKLSKEFLEKDINTFSFKEIGKFQKLMSYHNNLYYNENKSIISDYDYDMLRNKLKKIEKKHNFISNYIFSSDIGANFKESTFKKVTHSRPMISLDNTYNEEDLKKFDERVKKNLWYYDEHMGNQSYYSLEIFEHGGTNYILEFKFDGLGIELIYKKGFLTQAITRGNGIEGEDVTENIMQIENIPKKIDYKEHLEVRGEIVMPISIFEKLNKKAKKDGTKIFSNPRNAAAGSIRMKNNRVTKQRKLKFFAYDLANFEEFRIKEKKEFYFDVIKELECLDFEISSYFEICKDIKEVINKIKSFGNLKKQLDFEIDGLVLKVNNIDLWKSIGSTEHHPKYAIAYKFPAEILTTKILSVDHQIGRTGAITPVANLEPINISGAMIKRATLHNYQEVESLDVRVGDYIFIKRAGEVIPKIISVVEKENKERKKLEKIKAPKKCLSCSTKILKDNDKVRYYCPNYISCPAQIAEKLIFAVGKGGFDIDGFGERQIKSFLEKGIITDLVSIFKIKQKKEEILELEGFQEKSVENLISGIEKAKNINIHTLISALAIPGVGKKTAKTISTLIISEKSNLFKGKVNIEELEKLKDIGPEVANNVVSYFNNKFNKDFLKELISLLNIEYYKEKSIDNTSVFFEKKVCITGSFKNYKRDDLVKILEEKGGNFTNTVSKKTDFLVAGKKAGSKLKKAKDFGVKVLSLEEFLKLIG